MLRSCTALLLLALGFAAPARATIRYVDNVGGEFHYSTIAAALTPCVDGDTVLVGPGSYDEDAFIDDDIVFIGAGHDQTLITGGFNITSFTDVKIEGVRAFADNTLGWTITANGSSGAVLDVDRCHLRPWTGNSGHHCLRLASSGMTVRVSSTIFETTINNQSLTYLGDNQTEFENCVFVCRTNGTAVIAGTPASLVVGNCVFLGCARVFQTASLFPMLVYNCVAYDWSGTDYWGTAPAGATFEYNASSDVAPPGVGGVLLTANPFVDYDPAADWDDADDLRLDPTLGAPCVDSGQPALLDLDGSRSDMGLYGGPRPFVDGGVPSFPFVLTLDVPGAITVGDPLPIEAPGRIGRSY